jgi:hypothetical protein
MPSVDVNVNDPPRNSTPTTPTTPTTPIVPIDPLYEADYTGTINQAYWDNFLWAKGRQTVILNTASSVDLVAPNGNFIIPHGGTFIVQGGGLKIGAAGGAATLNAAYGTLVVSGTITNDHADSMVFLEDAAAAVVTGGKVGYKWDGITPVDSLGSLLYISGWKVDAALLSTDVNKMVYVENAVISGDVNLDGKRLTIQGKGTLTAEAAVTSLNLGETPTVMISKLDLNGKAVTLTYPGTNITEITSGTATAVLTIPSTGLAAATEINVQAGKDIRVNIADGGTTLTTGIVKGSGAIVVATPVTKVDIAANSAGNVRFADPQGMTIDTASNFRNTGLTTFDGPVTLNIGGLEFAGSTKFNGAVTLKQDATFKKDAAFVSLALDDGITPTFDGVTTIGALTAPAALELPALLGPLVIAGTGEVFVNTFNRGGILTLTKTGGSLNLPWFSSVASLTGDFTLGGTGSIALTTKPLLPEPPASPPNQTRRLIYNGDGATLTLKAGASITRKEDLTINNGKLIVPVGQKLLIGEKGAVKFAVDGGLTLAAGSYDGPLDIVAAEANFNGEIIVRSPNAEFLAGTAFNGNATFEGPVVFKDNVPFSGDVIFKDTVFIAADKTITAKKDLTLYPGKGIVVDASDPAETLFKAGDNYLVLSAAAETVFKNTGFTNTDLTTFSGPVTFGKTFEFAGSVKFTGDVTLNKATVFKKNATFNGLLVLNGNPTFEDDTTIATLSIGHSFTGDAESTTDLEITGAAAKTTTVSTSFNRGAITKLEMTAGSISIPWFTSSADEFTFGGNGHITLSAPPQLPEGKQLIYAATTPGILTLAAGASISHAEALKVTGTGTLEVSEDQTLLIDAAGTLPFTTGSGITLLAGAYNGPLEVTNTAATFSGATVFKAPAVTEPATIAKVPYGTFQKNAVFEAPVEITGAVTFDDVIFNDTVILKDTVQLVDGKTITTAAGKKLTLYAGKAIQAGANSVLTAGAGNLVLSPIGATSFKAAAASKTITVDGADITLDSGSLMVNPGATLALAKDLTLGESAKLILNADGDSATLSGAGKVKAGYTQLNYWTATGGPVTIEPAKISASVGVSLASVDGAASIVLNQAQSTEVTALEISGVDVQLTQAGSKVEANSGAGTAATITLSGSARISGLTGSNTAGTVSVIGGSGTYEHTTIATPDSLKATTTTIGSAVVDNYLHQANATVVTLTVTGDTTNQVLSITNAVYATANGSAP